MSNTNHTSEDKEELIWYASIGSMMNPVGLHNRNIYPKMSVPCIIHNYERKFYQPTGMATIVQKNGAVCHSVAHQLTRSEMQDMETREPHSVQLEVELLLPTGEHSIVKATSSVAPFKAEGKPTERYIDIMCRGAEAAGMSVDHVDALRATPCIPRKEFSKFQKFVVAQGGCDRFFKPEELLGHPNEHCYIVWNRSKVLFCDQSDPEIAKRLLRPIDPPTPETTPATGGEDITVMCHRTGANALLHLRDGWDITMFTATQFHEPRYCEHGVKSMEDVSEEHLAWLEDFMSTGILGCFQHVGYLRT